MNDLRPKGDPEVKKALAAFTFKGQMERYAPKRGARLPLAPMLRSLQDMTPDEWTLYAFAADPIEGRFSREEKLELGRRARACGEEEARALLAGESGAAQPSLIAKRLGVSIRRQQMPDDTDGRVEFARFVEPDAIILFMDTADKAAACLGARPDIARLFGGASVEQVLAAHELFHVVEMQKADAIFTRRHRVTLWKLGPLRHTSCVQSLSEIAGMAFAQTLLRLPFSPYLYDVFFVSLYDARAASDTYRMICRASGHASIEQTMTRQEMADALAREASLADAT